MAYAPPPETVALVRRRYAEGAFVNAIVAESGIKNLNIIYRCVAGLYPDGSGVKPAPIPQRRQGVRVRHRMGSRAALVSRMWRTAERQIEEIEDRLAVAGLELVERESNARTLAIVAKTLRELSAVDESDKPRKGKKQPSDDDIDNDPVPRDMDEFRRELARRINALVDSRTDAGGGGGAA
ncbi:MAG: hypothetical protein QOF09_3015 [Alphaproteobacteria bacterium]|jgi:hypothetical protein|nr:hypothetical protein [Alphaproteobacteria bacterium]